MVTSTSLFYFNSIFRWAAFPSTWKSSVVVQVFKRDGDPHPKIPIDPSPLVSCASKIFEHMIHSRIAPYIFPQLDWCQGGFRWGADVMACSPCDSLRLPCNTHTLVALIDTKKAFDSCWVEAKLLRLPDIGVSGRMWHGIANFYRGTHSQVRIGESSSQCWVDSGIAQGRVLSPLLCDLLVDSLAPSLRSAVPVVRLVCFDVSHLVTPMTWSFRLSHKQTSKLLLMWLVRAWGVRWRLPFSHGPNKSASIVIWANSLLSNVSRPSRWQSCSVQTFGRSFSILILVGALMSITDVLAETACSTKKPSPPVFPFPSSTPSSCPVSPSGWNVLAATSRVAPRLTTRGSALGTWHR